MITPREFVGAKSEKRTVSIYPKHTGVHIALLGASMGSNLLPSKRYQPFFTLNLGSEDSGVIALEFTNRVGVNYHAFCKISIKENVATIDLENNMVSFEGTLAGFDGDDIELVIDGKRFTTKEEDNDGKTYVAEGRTLFCKYIANIVPAQAVIGVAEKAVEEKSAIVELAELKKELLKVVEDRNNVRERHIELLKEHVTAMETMECLYKEIDFLEKSRDGLNKIALDLNNSLNGNFWRKRKRIDVVGKILNAYVGMPCVPSMTIK